MTVMVDQEQEQQQEHEQDLSTEASQQGASQQGVSQQEVSEKTTESQQQDHIFSAGAVDVVWQDDDGDFGLEQDNDELKNSEFVQLFEESCSKLGEIKEGAIISGLITSISGDYAIVDIGHKTDAEVPLYEFKEGGEDSEPLNVSVGDKVDVYLESFENRHGDLVLSFEKAQLVKAWDNLALAFENGDVVQGKVVRRVKGGLHVDVGVRAFLPGSQIDLRPVKNLDNLVGETFDYKIIKFNKARANVVLSRRVLLEHDREKVRTQTIDNLKEGINVKGIVKNLTDYGAFVDLGGVDGLLHITDMSWGRVSHPSQLFEIGQELEVVVLSYDAKSLRVSLGYKQLQEDPWSSVVKKYAVGSKARGVVVSLTDYGAFVELENGIEGLIHISEMSWSKRIRHPSKLVAIGDEVDVMILGVDTNAKRISLGMKQLETNPWDSIEEKYHIGDVISGKIRNITDFGIFVAVEEGVDALIHVSDISWTERMRRPAEKFHKGQEIQAKVLQINTVEEKFSLGIKQLQEDPWANIVSAYTVGSRHKGVVSKVMNFGVFVKMEQGFEGLIHVSELNVEHTIRRPVEYMNVGDEIEYIVLNMVRQDRKISLSKKAVDLGLEGEELKKYIARYQMPSSSATRSFQPPSVGDVPPPQFSEVVEPGTSLDLQHQALGASVRSVKTPVVSKPVDQGTAASVSEVKNVESSLGSPSQVSQDQQQAQAQAPLAADGHDQNAGTVSADSSVDSSSVDNSKALSGSVDGGSQDVTTSSVTDTSPVTAETQTKNADPVSGVELSSQEPSATEEPSAVNEPSAVKGSLETEAVSSATQSVLETSVVEEEVKEVKEEKEQASEQSSEKQETHVEASDESSVEEEDKNA